MFDLSASILSDFLLFSAFMTFASKRLMTYMHAYQQEEYDTKRLHAWMRKHKVFDRKLSLILLIAGLAAFLTPWFLIHLIILLAFAYTIMQEKDPRHDSKKALTFTSRAKRIYIAAMILGTIIGAFIVWSGINFLWIIAVQLLPYFLMLGNYFLVPYENATQQKFWNEAHNKLKTLSPTVIGITGSYGKTSVKHILGHLLKNAAPTLITPGSVNTPMGIARIIREELDESHKYFIVEMGAYGPGSIERLCKLAPPDFGIITAIGHAHYERFKSLSAVTETKFELAQATVNRSGKVIVNEATLKSPYSNAMYHESQDSYLICATEDMQAPLVIKKVKQAQNGIEIQLKWHQTPYLITMPIFGLHHGVNAALAFGMACTLGMDPQTVANTLKTMPQIPHRLEVKNNKELGIKIIDDAYNANPQGFRSALDLLHTLGHKTRRILITPGVVELGAAHDEVHKSLGEYAVKRCDICIALTPERIPTFVETFENSAVQSQTFLKMNSFDEAQKWITANAQKGDVVLIENDLPDIYERVPKL